MRSIKSTKFSAKKIILPPPLTFLSSKNSLLFIPEEGAAKQLDTLCKLCSMTNQKIYLFIDEYDHFTNHILSDAARLDEYLRETHGTGYLRTFFDTIKSGTYSSIERVFVTGVSPVTLDDLTSGFNIGTNNSLSYGFNEMVKEEFPAENIASNDNFISLLYYFGLVTIGGACQGDTRFVIPNEVVREQIFTYLLEAYKENDLSLDSYDIRKKEQLMAYCGDFKPFFQYIADSIYTYASQRERQKGEAFVHGYTLALASQCRFYRPISELDTQGGYADIFLHPLTEIFTDMEHAYIIELKYLKSQTTEAEVQAATAQAQAQVCRYADTVNVQAHIAHTQLHKVYVVYRGVEMVACEEIGS